MFRAIVIAAALLSLSVSAQAQQQQFLSVRLINKKLAGRIDDYTHNHCHDNRIHSRLLGRKQDIYVYVPPGYSRTRGYPLVLWLHGGFGDEHAYLDSARLVWLDEQIRTGCLPPMIVACADATCTGRNCITTPHSFYADCNCGAFESNLVSEVLHFVTSRYSVCGCRDHHALVGVSAGGSGAMRIALKYKHYFGVVATASAPLNLRYDNTQGDCLADFSPATYRWRTEYDPDMVVGRMLSGWLPLRAKTFMEPVWGPAEGIVPRIQRDNPADLLFMTSLQPGELKMLVAYGKQDELNFDAHAESFIWLAGQRGVSMDVACDPEGQHSLEYFRKAQLQVWQWVGQQFNNASCQTSFATADTLPDMEFTAPPAGTEAEYPPLPPSFDASETPPLAPGIEAAPAAPGFITE